MEEKKKEEAALTEACSTLAGMNGKIYHAQDDARITKEVTEKAQEEATRSKEEAAIAKEATVKAREEATRYEEDIQLDKGKRQAEADLATARENYAGLKTFLLEYNKAQAATEEKEKKALEEIEREKMRFETLADDVERLKEVLQEREGAITLSGKLVEDLRVKKTEMACFVKKLERENTDLVGENTALHERVRGKCLALKLFFWCVFSWKLTFALGFFRA